MNIDDYSAEAAKVSIAMLLAGMVAWVRKQVMWRDSVSKKLDQLLTVDESLSKDMAALRAIVDNVDQRQREHDRLIGKVQGKLEL